MLNREYIVNKLREGVVVLEFEKVDATRRTMTATLDSEMFDYTPKENSSKKKSDESLAVWDVDKNGWRSFRWDKLRLFDGSELPNGV